ncbi:MAG: ribonuclease E activity regulator RraA, partial [Burkholderiales bacterium]
MSSPILVTGDLCDLHKSEHDGSFRVLPPSFQNYGKRVRFAGVISTVKCFEDNSLVKAALEAPGNGRVLVVDGGSSFRRALVGGKIAASAAKNGWAGIVVDGCVRDSA